MELSLILVILSGGGVIFLLAIRFLSIKNLSRDELYQGIVLSRPFFCDFNKFLTPIAKLIIKIYNSILSRKEFMALKKRYCNFSNYMRGQHSVEKNGCSGYWGEVNGCKENSKEKDS